MQMMTDDFINSFNLISHTEPNRKLIVHLEEVYNKAQKRLDELDINFDLLSISHEQFENLLQITVFCHDFGKSSMYFQKKILEGLTKGKEEKEKKLSEHGLISAFFGYFVAVEKFRLDKRFASLVFMAIRYHHLDLDNAETMQTVDELAIQNVLKIFKGIKKNSSEIDAIYHHFLDTNEVIENFGTFLITNFPENEIEYLDKFFWFKDEYQKNDIFVFMLLFSLLIYADKEDAIFRDRMIEKIKSKCIDSSKVDDFKSEYFKTRDKAPLDNVREKIYQSIVHEFNNVKENKVFFIKLPTGAGKTLLLYKLALQIKEEQNYQKVFYLLPFITLIEQNASILKDLLSFMDININDNRIFLEKHSLSGEFLIEQGLEEYDIDKKQFLLDTLDSEFVVTSFHQLFYGVFKRKNALFKRFHQFANSIILIDEVQLIPLELMYPVTQFLKFMSEIFNCKIIVASATFPNIKKEILNDSYTFKTIDTILTPEENLQFFNRYKITVDIVESYTFDKLFEKIDDKLQTQKDLLFRVNTVNTANTMYEYLINKDSSYRQESIFLLTSAIAPINRQEIIKKIKSNSSKGIQQIVVATQLIQAGVDISLEDGFEELAPLDLIVQSMGRRNRSAEKLNIGTADIIKIKNDKNFEGHKIYNNFDIEQTCKILNNYQTLSEQQIYSEGLLDSYYNSQVEIKSIDAHFQKLNFLDIDKEFVLIANAPLTFSFFIPLNKDAVNIWKILVELDKKKRAIKQDKNFWKNMKEIENEYSKIKKSVNLYTVNQNFYYMGEKKEIANTAITEDFENALGIYLATENIFDEYIGLQLVEYVKDKVEGLFW
ncbi:MAG: CRISPR-associated helicase Cas3' [Arcobacteraceae bacterium]